MRRALAAFSMIALVLAACGGSNEPATPGTELKSDEQRITNPDAGDLPELVAGNTAFAVDLYQALGQGEDNLFFSPASISIALAMTWAGARGTTESQMADSLHFTLDQQRLHPAFDALDLALSSRGQGAAGQDGEPFRLHVVNQLFGQTDYAFLDDFLDTLALYYGAGLRLLDFEADPEGGRLVINDWVAEQTEQRIEDLIPPGAIDSLTRLVLVNAIYFNAAWKDVFDDQSTYLTDFHRLDGSTVEVPMMVQPEFMAYAEGEGWEAAELPYDGDELSMVVIVPADGAFGQFEQTLSAERLDDILGALGQDFAMVNMPRFSLDGASISLKDTLTALGMPDAFDGAKADFSGMDGTRELHIGDVIHQAFISVDEYGTEAAAATAVIMEGGGMPKVMVADRPFVYLIRDLATGDILFMGRETDPSVGG